jgi:hypothetical protein
MDNDALYRVADEFEFFDEIKFEELNQKVQRIFI